MEKIFLTAIFCAALFYPAPFAAGADAEPAAAQSGNIERSLIGTWAYTDRSDDGGQVVGKVYTFKTDRTFEHTTIIKLSSINSSFILTGSYWISGDVLTTGATHGYQSNDGGKTFKSGVLWSSSKFQYTFGVEDNHEYVELTSISDKNSDDDSETSTGKQKYYKQREMTVNLSLKNHLEKVQKDKNVTARLKFIALCLSILGIIKSFSVGGRIDAEATPDGESHSSTERDEQ